MRRYILFITIGFSCFLALPVTAASWYVDGTSGNDTTGDNSSSSPYATVEQVVSVMNGGDTIYCKGTIIQVLETLIQLI